MSMNKKDTHGMVLYDNDNILNMSIKHYGVSEALKSSNRTNVTVSGCFIFGGVEDVVDVVRGDAVFTNCTIATELNSKQHVTVKGGATVTFINCNFVGLHSPTKDPTISVGDFTIYDGVQKNRPKSKVILHNCIANDTQTQPIHIKCMHGTCEYSNTLAKVTKYPSFLVKLYFAVCRLILSKERKAEALRNLQESPDRV